MNDKIDWNSLDWKHAVNSPPHKLLVDAGKVGASLRRMRDFFKDFQKACVLYSMCKESDTVDDARVRVLQIREIMQPILRTMVKPTPERSWGRRFVAPLLLHAASIRRQMWDSALLTSKDWTMSQVNAFNKYLGHGDAVYKKLGTDPRTVQRRLVDEIAIVRVDDLKRMGMRAVRLARIAVELNDRFIFDVGMIRDSEKAAQRLMRERAKEVQRQLKEAEKQARKKRRKAKPEQSAEQVTA